MTDTWRDTSIALAGALQCIQLVEELAKTGYLKSDQFEVAVKSLFIQSPESTESVYGGVQHLRMGLETLRDLLENHKSPKHGDKIRYLLGIIHLQKRLMSKPDLLDVISSRLEKAKSQAKHFNETHDNVVANIAGIYLDTVSKFNFRIQVAGEYTYLQQQRVADQVRTLLLAAIRSAILWRQVGGSRWHLIFYRSKLSKAVEGLLEECRTH